MMRLLCTLVCLPMFLALFGGCDEEPSRKWTKQVNAVLDRREKAFNEHDLTLYLAAISKEYGGGGSAYTDVRERAVGLFREIEGIRYTSSQRQLYEQDDGDVMSVQRFTMELEVDGEIRSRSGVERIFHAKQDGYKIVGGL